MQLISAYDIVTMSICSIFIHMSKNNFNVSSSYRKTRFQISILIIVKSKKASLKPFAYFQINAYY